jgi:acetyl-CoA carboxylase carboxyl transferase subunit beta
LLGLFADRGEHRPAQPPESFSGAVGPPAGSPRERRAGWEERRLACHPRRPRAGDYLARLMTEWIEVRGDRAGADDRAIVTGLGRIAGIPVAVIAGERGQPAGVGAFRKAERLLRLAGHLELPVVCLVDSTGISAEPSGDAAQASSALASMLALSGMLPVPVVAAVIGEADGPAGVALGVGDRLLMQEHAVFTVAGGEGVDRRAAAPLAASRTLTASECLRLGVADAIIPEPRPAAHADIDAAARALGAAIATALTDLSSVGPRRLLDDRAAKLRSLGQTTPEAREAARHEVRELQELQKTLARSLGELRERIEALRLPQLPESVRGRVHIDTSAMPTLERARAEFVERAVRLASRLPSETEDGGRKTEDVGPTKARDEA